MLTREEATRLLAALAPHQRQLMRFALATGLRNRTCFISSGRRSILNVAPRGFMPREAIGVPLNGEAMAVLRDERGKHPTSVFTFHRRPLKSMNTKAWKKGLKRAGIENFRWHDLRHVWATWHVMAGTTLGELQELGAWKSETMVKRYSHFAPEQLRRAADRTR